MSWLYTILFAGLAFSSQGSSVQNSTPDIQVVPAAVEARNLDEVEKFDQTYVLNANGKISLSNINGSIVVEAWDRNEVRLEYTKTADSKERLSEVEVKINSRPDALSVETNYDNWKQHNNSDRWRNGGKLQVDYHLMVPRGAFLNEVETVNGSVTGSANTCLDGTRAPERRSMSGTTTYRITTGSILTTVISNRALPVIAGHSLSGHRTFSEKVSRVFPPRESLGGGRYATAAIVLLMEIKHQIIKHLLSKCVISHKLEKMVKSSCKILSISV